MPVKLLPTLTAGAIGGLIPDALLALAAFVGDKGLPKGQVIFDAAKLKAITPETLAAMTEDFLLKFHL